MPKNNSNIETNTKNAQTNNGNNRYDVYNDLPFKMALPMVAVGTFLLALSLAFCCYMMRKKTRVKKTCGYKKVTIKRNDKNNTLDNLKHDACAVCLEDFKVKNVLAVCPCDHVFHKKCLVKWLKLRKTCPLCMAHITVSYHQSYATGHSSVTISLNQPPDTAL